MLSDVDEPSTALGRTLWATVLLLSVFCFATIIRSVFKPGLKNIPGPFWPKITSFWLVYHAPKANFHYLFIDLHRKYGSIVRFAPNKICISDPDAIPIIYGINSKFAKAEFYDSFTAVHENKFLPNLFATRDPAWHKHNKSIVAPAYSLSYLRHLEPLIDDCTSDFQAAMHDLTGQLIDFGEWLQWYAFDAIGNLTFSTKFDFIRNRADKLNVISGLHAGLKYNTICGQLPVLHWWLLGNSTLTNLLMRVPAIAKANPVIVLNKMTAEAINSSRRLDIKTDRGNFLDYLRKVQAEKRGKLADRDMWTALLTNLFAGSDTTATGLRAIFYFLVKHPAKYAKLKDEIVRAEAQGNLSEFVSFQEGLALEYLQATIKESLRLHPGVSYPLERVVPSGGAELCGHFLPEGTVVGMHAWVVHRDRSVFGKDADEFRPERWLEADVERGKKMDHAFLAFGSGSRICLGKHISMLEMTKFVPQLLRHFDVEWASEKEEWGIEGYWFAKQTGLTMRLVPKKREEVLG